MKRRAFTLIELLLVIGIIAILASIVIVAINPTKQLGDARNAQRRSDVNTILNVVYQYAIDNNGTLPGGTTAPITTTPTEICCTDVATDAACATAGGVFLKTQLEGTYVVAIPGDAQPTVSGCNETPDDDLTGYRISKDANGRVTVTALGAEQSATISVTR